MKTPIENRNSKILSVDPENKPLDLINISFFIEAGVFKNTGEKIGFIKDICFNLSTGQINSFLVEIDESEKEITIPYYFLIFNSKNRVFILNKDLDKLNDNTTQAYNLRIDLLNRGLM